MQLSVEFLLSSISAGWRGHCSLFCLIQCSLKQHLFRDKQVMIVWILCQIQNWDGFEEIKATFAFIRFNSEWGALFACQRLLCTLFGCFLMLCVFRVNLIDVTALKKLKQLLLSPASTLDEEYCSLSFYSIVTNSLQICAYFAFKSKLRLLKRNSFELLLSFALTGWRVKLERPLFAFIWFTAHKLNSFYCHTFSDLLHFFCWNGKSLCFKT